MTRCAWFALVPLICLAGCGRRGDDASATVAVNGFVLLDGAAMADGSVIFSASGGRPIEAVVANGSFTAKLPPATYRVEVYSYVEGPPVPKTNGPGTPDSKRNVVAARFNSQSTLTETIAAGSAKELKYAVATK